MKFKIAALLFLHFFVVAIASDFQIVSVQSPAWFERGNIKRPLTAGISLKPNDQIITGPNARVLIQLSEGSKVKLGENANFTLSSFNQTGGVFQAALDVAKGAFRFTTDSFFKERRRAVNIRVSTVTAGIRGTDLWGKSTDEKDLVCLLEGKIEVGKEGNESVIMDKPLTFYVAPKNGAPLPVAPVDPQNLKVWAQETEIQPGLGALRTNSPWHVIAASVKSSKMALELYDELNQMGYPAKIRQNGKIWTIGVYSVASEKDAEFIASVLQKQGQFKDARSGFGALKRASKDQRS